MRFVTSRALLPIAGAYSGSYEGIEKEAAHSQPAQAINAARGIRPGCWVLSVFRSPPQQVEGTHAGPVNHSSVSLEHRENREAVPEKCFRCESWVEASMRQGLLLTGPASHSASSNIFA